MHGIAYFTVFIHAAPMDFFFNIQMLFLCSFIQSLTSLYLNQANRLHVCAVYSQHVCKHMHIAVPTYHGTSTTLSASAFRPGIFSVFFKLRNYIGVMFRSIKYHQVSFQWGKISFAPGATSNDTCVGVESKWALSVSPT